MQVAATPPLELPPLLPLLPLLLPLVLPSPPRRVPELPPELASPPLWPSLNAEEPPLSPHAATVIPTTPAMPATHLNEGVRMESPSVPMAETVRSVHPEETLARAV
jgi:hypothetical protein